MDDELLQLSGEVKRCLGGHGALVELFHTRVVVDMLSHVEADTDLILPVVPDREFRLVPVV